MLKYGALVAFLLSLWLSEAIMETIYTSLNVTPIVEVSVRQGGCYYNGTTFYGLHFSENPCQRLSCNPQSKIVVKMECGDPAEGCVLDGGGWSPGCCRVRCPRLSICVLKNGTLMKSGEVINSTDPCLRYMCKDGFLFTQKCAAPPAGCFRDALSTAPFPYCCRTNCPQIHVCVTDGGTVLKEGESVNSTDPCVKYTCRNGNLAIEACAVPSDSTCSLSLANTSGPYPLCCGVARVCTG